VYVGALTGLKSTVIPLGSLFRSTLPRHYHVPQGRDPRPRPVRRAAVQPLDELDGQMWLDDVFIRGSECSPSTGARGHPALVALAPPARLAGEGRVHPCLALALTDAMGLKQNETTVGYLVDLMAEVQTVRSCLTAASTIPHSRVRLLRTEPCHLAAGGISLFKARPLMSEILRIIPGSSLVWRPPTATSRCPSWHPDLRRRSAAALVGEATRCAAATGVGPRVVRLDGRESAFELHASGGMRDGARGCGGIHGLQQSRERVLEAIEMPMPVVDVAGIGRRRSRRDEPLRRCRLGRTERRCWRFPSDTFAPDFRAG